jgi:hypothetical protein
VREREREREREGVEKELKVNMAFYMFANFTFN